MKLECLDWVTLAVIVLGIVAIAMVAYWSGER